MRSDYQTCAVPHTVQPSSLCIKNPSKFASFCEHLHIAPTALLRFYGKDSVPRWSVSSFPCPSPLPSHPLPLLRPHPPLLSLLIPTSPPLFYFTRPVPPSHPFPFSCTISPSPFPSPLTIPLPPHHRSSFHAVSSTPPPHKSLPLSSHLHYTCPFFPPFTY